MTAEGRAGAGAAAAGGHASPAFVGRAAELATLRGELDRVVTEGARGVLVGGEAGIGKTTLVQHFLSPGIARPPRWLWGTAPVPAGERIPYAPLLEMMRQAEADSTAARLLEPLRADLAPLLLARGAVVDRATDEFARHRLLLALRTFLEHLAATDPPLVFVLDDVQWADVATLDALSFLVHQLRSAPVLIVVVYRSDEIDGAPALRRLLVELTRLDHVTPVDLGHLRHEDLISISGLEPELSGAHLRQLAERSGGNPYLFRLLTESTPSRHDELPPTLRAALLQRVADLPPAAAEVARLAAVAGDAATGRLLAALRPSSPETGANATREGLRVLVQRRILDPPAGPNAAYSFHHPLLEEAVLEELLPDERAEHHARVAAALEAHADILPTPLHTLQVAIHWAAADEMDRSLPALIAGADTAAAMYAFELAHELLEQAIVVAEAIGEPRVSPPQRVDLAVRTAETAFLAGRPERAVQLAEWAWQRRRMPPDRESLVLERTGWYHFAAGDVTAALDALRRAVARGDDADAGVRSRALASYGRVLMLDGRYADARPALEQAITEARAAGSLADESRALSALGVVLVRSGEEEAGAARLDAARRLDEQRDRSLLAPRPSRIGYLIGEMLDRATGLEDAGRLESAAVEARGALETARRIGGDRAWSAAIAARSANEYFRVGRWDDAEAEIARALDDSTGPDRAALLSVSARIAAARGRLTEAVEVLSGAAAAARSLPAPIEAAVQAAAAEVELARSSPSTARDAAGRGLDRIAGSEQDGTVAELAALGLQADADLADAARLRRSSVELAAIREDALLLAAVAGIAARPGGGGSTGGRVGAMRLLGAAEHSRVEGHPDPQLWAAAAAAFDALGEPHRAAMARRREAEALLALRGDRARARDSLRAAHSVARRLGATWLSKEIELVARRSRLDLGPADAEEAPAGLAHPGAELGLSGRELEVLQLVADGRTNRQIAAALFISERTAAHHVSSILAKLNVDSRGEAAAAAHRLGIAGPTTEPE